MSDIKNLKFREQASFLINVLPPATASICLAQAQEDGEMIIKYLELVREYVNDLIEKTQNEIQGNI